MLNLTTEGKFLNKKNKNKDFLRSVREYLSQLVDELLIPEEMIEAICTAQLNEQAFMEQLYQLNRKIRFMREQTYHDTEACKDVSQVIDNLRLKGNGLLLLIFL